MENTNTKTNTNTEAGIIDEIAKGIEKMAENHRAAEWMNAHMSAQAVGSATEFPRNGAKCVIYRKDGDGSESWDIAQWIEKDTVVQIWKGCEHRSEGYAGLLADLIMGKKADCQTIGKSGFYCLEETPTEPDGFLRYRMISPKEISCWIELKSPESEPEPKKEPKKEPKRRWEFRLADGSLLSIKTIKEIGADKAAFRWVWVAKAGIDAHSHGEFAARFDVPEGKTALDLDDVGGKLADWILTERFGIEDPRGLYDEI